MSVQPLGMPTLKLNDLREDLIQGRGQMLLINNVFYWHPRIRFFFFLVSANSI